MVQTSRVPRPEFVAIVLLILLVAGLSIWFLIPPQSEGPQPAADETADIAPVLGQPVPPTAEVVEAPAAKAPEPAEQSKPPFFRAPANWLAKPPEFPKQGFKVSLVRSTGGEPPQETARVFEDVVEVRQPLPDGIYGLRTGETLYFPHWQRPWIVVKDGVATIRPERDAPGVFNVMYLVPVRVMAELVGRAEIQASARSETELDRMTAYIERLDLTHGVAMPARFPRCAMRFVDGDGGLSIDLGAIDSSLGDRIPEPDELIVLKPRRNTELHITVVNQEGGWLKSALPMASPDQSWNADNVSLSLRIDGWLARGEITMDSGKTLAQLIAGSAEAPTISPFSILLPPPAKDATIRVELRARRAGYDDPMIMILFRGVLLATGRAELKTGQARYEIELVPYRSDGEVTVTVKDTEGRPRPFLPVHVDSVRTEGRTTTRLGSLQGRTNDKGEAVFTGVPMMPDIQIEARVQLFGLRENRKRVIFEQGQSRAAVEFIIPSDTLTPLVFQFVPDALPERESVFAPVERGGMKVRMGVNVCYAITSYGGNSGNDKAANVTMVDDWLVVTDYVQAGRFAALLDTPFGEYLVEGRHESRSTEPVRVVLESYSEVRVTCVDLAGAPMEGVVIFPVAADAAHAWGNAAGRALLGNPMGVSRRATGKDGTAKLTAPSRASQPAAWRYVHPDLGVMLAESVGGDAASGFRVTLKLDTLGAASVTVKVDNPARRPGLKYHVTLRIPSPGDIVDARTNMGWMKTLEGDAESVTFKGVPPGTYEVKVSPTTGTGLMTPPAGWHTRIELKAGEQQSLVFPKS